MKRVLRPGGRLLLLDHVRASSKVWLSVQRRDYLDQEEEEANP